MNTNVYLIIYIFISIFIYFLFYLFKQKQERNLKQKNKEIENLKACFEAQKKVLTSYEDTKKTTFVSSEITKRKILEEEISKYKNTIQDTRRIAQNANQIKKEFLENIQHELRTPMNSILVFAEMLKKSLMDKQLNIYASNIIASGEKLQKLLNNIIELSELESKEIVFNNTAVDISTMLNKEIEKHRPSANKKGLRLLLNIDENIPEFIMLDRERVEEIINNLIDNAIRFTQDGEVKVQLSFKDFNSLKNQVNISLSVQDTGIGIAQEDYEKIFNIFDTRDTLNPENYQGNGISLSINKKIANLMNADILLESEQGIGSTFTFVLKNMEVLSVSEESLVDEDKINFKLINKSTFVVVDDSQETLEKIVGSFKNTNVEVFAFDNTRDAIAYMYLKSFDLLIINQEVLTMDDGAVSKVLEKILKAPFVCLYNYKLSDVDSYKSGLQPIGYIKKPLTRLELFKTALKIINSQEFIIAKDGGIDILVEKALSFSANVEESKKYFTLYAKDIDRLLEEIVKTNDLKSIKKFALSIRDASSRCKVIHLEEYANNLLDAIRLLDIQLIDSMINEYKFKADTFKEQA